MILVTSLTARSWNAPDRKVTRISSIVKRRNPTESEHVWSASGAHHKNREDFRKMLL